MQRDTDKYGNYGRYTDSSSSDIYTDYASYSPPPRPFASRKDRVWATAAHLSTFVNTFTGFLGPVVALVIWFVKRDDSPMVARHAMRSAVYQSLWLITIAAGWAIAVALSAILVGFLLYPVMAVVTIAPFVHSVIAAVGAWRENEIYI